MEELFEKINKANKEIKTINLKGKEYCEVKERVVAYRKVYPDGIIQTEVTWQDNYVVCKATVTDNIPTSIADGYARELLSKPFALENCQTSAIGRALGFAGFGISTSIATAEDMENVNEDNTGNMFDGVDKFVLIQKIKEKYDIKEQANLLNLNNVKRFEDMSVDDLGILVGSR